MPLCKYGRIVNKGGRVKSMTLFKGELRRFEKSDMNLLDE